MTELARRPAPLRSPGRGGPAMLAQEGRLMIMSVRAELLRLRRWPAVWVLCGTWLVLNLTFGYLFDYLSYRSGDDVGGFADRSTEAGGAAGLLAQLLPDQVPVTLVQGLPIFGGALLLILGGLTVGSGYGWGTWKTVFTVRPRRSTALAGTYGALGVVLVLMIAATYAADMLAAIGVATAESQPLVWPGLADQARGLGAALLIGGMWLAAGALLGTLARSPALAVGLGLIWALVVENLLRGVGGVLGAVEAITKLTPGTAAGALVGALGAPTQSDPNGTPGVTTLIGGTSALLLLVGYVLAFAVAAMALTSRRDIAS